MKFFKKKTEETVRNDELDFDKLLSGDRKPIKPAKQPLPTRKLLIAAGAVGLVLVFALITMMVAISVGKRTDPNFGFKDLFAPTTAAATQPTTTIPETQKATLSTPPATKPTAKPTDPTQPTEPPLRFDEVTKGEITYLVPNKTLELSLGQYYCTSPSLPIPEDDAPEEEWLLFFYSLLADEDPTDNSIVSGTNSCMMCKRVILNAGIEKVVIRDTATEYRVINTSDWIEDDDSLSGQFGY